MNHVESHNLIHSIANLDAVQPAEPGHQEDHRLLAAWYEQQTGTKPYPRGSVSHEMLHVQLEKLAQKLEDSG